MSLTATDLQEIRNIIKSALDQQTDEDIKPLRNEIQALRNDIKEIYDMLAELQKGSTDNQFEKMTL